MNTNEQTMTTDAAVAALIAEGYAEADVLRAVDRIIYNDCEVPDDDDDEISGVEFDALRQELAASGKLMDYNTAEYLRPATADELAASQDAASQDGGAGVIKADGRDCYVVGD